MMSYASWIDEARPAIVTNRLARKIADEASDWITSATCGVR